MKPRNASEVERGLGQEEPPLGGQVFEWLIVVERAAEERRAALIVRLELQEPEGVEVEAERQGVVVGGARAVLVMDDVREGDRGVGRGLKPRREAIAEHPVEALADAVSVREDSGGLALEARVPLA